MTENLLKVENLKTSFFTHIGEVQSVRGVSFTVDKGEVIGIVGESGSGKSVTGKSIMRLIQYPGKIVEGSILFKGNEITKFSQRKMREIRGNEISMIFQDPMTSLNPVFKVGKQIEETILAHNKISKKDARKRAVKLLDMVKIPSPEKRVNAYPHEFSGGMMQRAVIAMALSCNPDLIIADEPTTALDVTIQDQILKLMKDLKNKLNTSIIFITHDLGVVAEICSRILVMYGGMIMEEGTREDIFYNSKHPYTKGLLKSVPRLDIDKGQKLVPIPGSPPNLLNPSDGCPFTPRCKYAMKICKKKCPPYAEISDKHRSMCWLLNERAPKYKEFCKGEM